MLKLVHSSDWPVAPAGPRWSDQNIVRHPGKPSRHCARWNEQEDSDLLVFAKSGTPVATLAKMHGRTVTAIEMRLDLIGFLTQ